MRRAAYILLPLWCVGCAAPKAAAPGAAETERELASPPSATADDADAATANGPRREARPAAEDSNVASGEAQPEEGAAGAGPGYGSGRGGIVRGGVDKKQSGPVTRYRLGDYVVYRYSGSALDEAVTLREEITAQEGLRLRIDVTATRAGETRAWVQVVTDTPQNQRDNVIDALFEKRGDGYVRLANEGQRDVPRLYAWVLVSPDGKASAVRREACARSMAGQEFACVCTSGRNTWQGRAVVFEDTECGAFLWSHGPGGFREAVGGDDVLRVEVVEAGRHEGARALPFDATAQ